MSAPCSCACSVSSTVSLAELAAVHAWITVSGAIARASSTATSSSCLRSSRVSDHHSPTPLVSQSMSWREVADAVAHQRAVRVPVDVVAVATAERRVQRVADAAQPTARGPFTCVLVPTACVPPWFDVLRVPKDDGAGGDRPVAVALVVDRELDADAPVAPAVRGAVDAERPDLAAREVHHVRALHLEPIGARARRREVDRRGLEDDVLRTEVERGVGRRELVGELRERPVPVGATAARRTPATAAAGRASPRSA